MFTSAGVPTYFPWNSSHVSIGHVYPTPCITLSVVSCWLLVAINTVRTPFILMQVFISLSRACLMWVCMVAYLSHNVIHPRSGRTTVLTVYTEHGRVKQLLKHGQSAHIRPSAHTCYMNIVTRGLAFTIRLPRSSCLDLIGRLINPPSLVRAGWNKEPRHIKTFLTQAIHSIWLCTLRVQLLTMSPWRSDAELLAIPPLRHTHNRCNPAAPNVYQCFVGELLTNTATGIHGTHSRWSGGLSRRGSILFVDPEKFLAVWHMFQLEAC